MQRLESLSAVLRTRVSQEQRTRSHSHRLHLQYLHNTGTGTGTLCSLSLTAVVIKTATPKNEYLHLFANAGLLERMSVTLRNLVTEAYKHNNASTDDDAEEDTSYLEKLTKICKVFSMGDSDVKLRICSKEVLSSNYFHCVKIQH